MKKQLLSILLIVHGLIHLMFEFVIYDANTATYVGWSRQSWALNTLGQTAVSIIGIILWSLTIAGFVVAGILLLIKQKAWRITTIVTSFISLIAYLLLWNGLAPEPIYWVVGPIIGGVAIVGLLIFRWPKDENLFHSKREQTV